MLIDSHCHLDFDYDGKTPDDLVQEAAQNGIQFLVTIGTDENSFCKVREISEKFPNVYHTIGIHPHEAKDLTEQTLNLIREGLTHPKCVALGEVGLDYYYNHSPKEVQIQGLKSQLALALQAKKPVVIHSRDGESDLLPILKDFATQFKAACGPDRIPGVIHCFTGTRDFAVECVNLGFRIGVSGIFTFKKSQELRDTIRSLPVHALMVETDSPFLAPEPMRGKKCMPFMVKHTAARLAQEFGIGMEEISKVTSENSMKVFGIQK